MSRQYQIVVCAGIVPDPWQTLEPVASASGPSLKNEMMLPAVLDPWGKHALFETANLAGRFPGSKVWLVSVAPRAKLQQVMMTIGQKVPFELIAVDAPANGFVEPFDVAVLLAEAINKIPDLDKNRLLLFGGWESASRGAGATMQIVGEILGISDQFQGVDELKISEDGTLEILERVEGGVHQVSRCISPPVVLGWATGNLPEPPNNPQIGMSNMRSIMPSIQKAGAAKVGFTGVQFGSVSLPKQKRETRIIKDMSCEEIAHELAAWINE